MNTTLTIAPTTANTLVNVTFITSNVHAIDCLVNN